MSISCLQFIVIHTLKGFGIVNKAEIYVFLQLSCFFHVWMWELDCEEGWAPKNWFFWTVVLEKNSWESLGLSASPLGWRSPRSVLCGGSFNISCSVQEFSLCSPDSLSTYGHSIGGHRMAAGCIPQTFFPYGTLSPLPPVLLGFRA